MSNPDIPSHILDALRAMAGGDHQAGAAVRDEVMNNMLDGLVNPDPDMPAALLDVMARSLAAGEAIDAESKQWDARQTEVLDALRDTPPIIVEYVDFLARTLMATKAGVADAVLGAVGELGRLIDAVDALDDTVSVPAAPPPEPTWRVGDLLRFDSVPAWLDGALVLTAEGTQVVLAVDDGGMVYHAAVDAPGSYFSNPSFALDRYATQPGHLGAIAMGDVRRRFVAAVGCTIEERLGLAEP